MQYDSTVPVLRSAFAVIRQTDQVTYARMQQEDWRVTVNAAEYLDTWQLDWETSIFMAHAYGVTMSAPHPMTWLNLSSITEWAQYNDAELADFAAAVLVHEFAHIHQPRGINPLRAEPSAFAASSSFAAKLPGADRYAIKALSDDMRAEFI